MADSKYNSVYSLGETVVFAGGVTASETFEINNINRDFKIKSVLFDILIYDTNTGKQLPLEKNDTQQFRLLVGTWAGPLLAQPFENILTPINVTFNGTAVSLYRPQQIHFNNWWNNGTLPFTFYYKNWDALTSYTVWWNVTVEIEVIV